MIPKGPPYFGDDVIENFVRVCGSGTFGCHGALHGVAYVRAGRRLTPADARRNVGATIKATRPDVIAYVLGKLGDVAGRDYLERKYYISLP